MPIMLLISPTKTLDFEPIPKGVIGTLPRMVSQIDEVAAAHKALSLGKMKGVLKVSDALTRLNYDRAQNFSFYSDLSETADAKCAAFAYTGDAFRAMDVKTLDSTGLGNLQNSLRIISGLYGCLRPLDKIQAYRLCMGDKLQVGGNKTLYDYWGGAITKALLADIEQNQVGAVVNVASDEYSKAVDLKQVRSVVPVYKMCFSTGGRTLALYSKQARGLMARYVAAEGIEEVEGLKSFGLGGYRFNETRSSEFEFVFDRSSAPAKATATKPKPKPKPKANAKSSAKPKAEPKPKAKAAAKSAGKAKQEETEVAVKAKKPAAKRKASAPAPSTGTRRSKRTAK